MAHPGVGQTAAVLRARRQLTLPRDVCEALGLELGDRLELSVEDGVLLARPRKRLALDALAEIQRLFAASGLSQDDLREEGRRLRARLTRKQYGQAG